MKTRFALMALLAAATLAGCQKQESQQTPGGDQTPPPAGSIVAPVLTASAPNVVLTEETASQVALTLTWTAASQDIQVKYDLYANLASRDLFTNAQKITTSAPLSHSFTGETLNQLMAALNATEATDIQFGVYVTASGHDSKLSNVAKVKVTPYTKTFVFPTALYVIGTATPYQWDLSKALQMTASSQGIYTAQNLSLRTEPLANNQSIKFAFSRDGSDKRFAGQAPAGAFGDITVVETGEGYEFFPARSNYTNGQYTVTVNLNTMKLTLTRTGDLPREDLPDKLYMLGGCFTWGWTFTGTTLDKVSDNVYEAGNVQMNFNESDPNNPNGFKIFLGVDKWSPYFAMTDDSANGNVKIQYVENSDVPQFYPGKIGYASGVYKIQMNFNTNVATFTLTGDVSPTEPDVLYLHGGCFNPAWAFSNDLVLSKTSSGVYEGDITIVAAESWDGFKIWTDQNWTKSYGASAESTHDNIIIVDVNKYKEDTGAEDAQVYPVTLGYQPGTYHFTLNLKTMRLTMTAK